MSVGIILEVNRLRQPNLWYVVVVKDEVGGGRYRDQGETREEEQDRGQVSFDGWPRSCYADWSQGCMLIGLENENAGLK